MNYSPETHTRDLNAIEAEARRLRAQATAELFARLGRWIAVRLHLRRSDRSQAA